MEVKLVTRKELASYFGVTYGTIYNWHKAGLIAAHSLINKSPRYDFQEVVKSISKDAKEGANPCR